MPTERLQKILSRAGVSSRRKAEELILSGKIQINGKVIRELGSRANPEIDRILVEGKPLQFQASFHYYAYYKPRGVVVSKRDELGRSSIFDYLQLPPAVNSVGRLDKDSEGLLLLTDDGEFLQRYTHPSFQVPKVYHVQITRKLAGEEKESLLSGMVLEGKKVRAIRVKNLNRSEGIWIELELREGIKREIRRMLEVFGIRILRLIRVQQGSVTLGRLKAGELIELSKKPL